MSERAIDVVPSLVRGQKRDGRCIYDRRAKQELVRRCQQPGVSVAAMALAHGLNANLLRKWITMASRRRDPSAPAASILLSVTTTPESFTAAPPSNDGYLEVVLPVGTIRLHGRVSVDALRMAIDCLSRRS
jgi:transposase-like protein